MAIRASKGAVEAEAEEGLLAEAGVAREVKSVVEAPRRSPALVVEAEADWIWEAAKRLFLLCVCLV